MRALTLLTCLCGTAAGAQQWVQLPDFPGSARDDAASFTIYEKTFVGTGLDLNFQLTDDWYVFDTYTEVWDTIAVLPASPRQYCTAFALDDKGYLFGGLDANGPLNELWCYDPGTDSWSAKASLPTAGRYASSVIIGGGHAFICTGMLAGNVPTNEVWRYDPVNDLWEQKAAVPGPPRHRAMSDDFLLAGGADSLFQALTDCYEYAYVTDTWIAKADLPEGRYAADMVDGILIGGASSPTQVHDQVWWYDWLGDAWGTTSFPPFMGGPRRGGTTGRNLVIADIGVIYFGLGSDNVQRYKDWWRLDFAVGIDAHRSCVLLLRPMPAANALFITYSDQAPHVLELVDLAGRTVHTWNGRPERIDVSELAPGRYSLLDRTNGGRRATPVMIAR